MSGESGHGLGTRTLRGIVWAYGSYVGGKFLVFLSTAVLARLLVPEDFGIVALALTFMALLEGVSDLGLSQALVIQRREVLYERAETVFVSSVAIGLVLSVILVALSPLVASFFDEPSLVAITAALGANFFLRSLGATHYALAQKELDFKARTLAELAGVVARGVIGIGLALAGLGVWSLVIGYLVGTIVLDVVIFAVVPWRPRFKPSMAHLRQMVVFGGTLSGVDILAALQANADYVFIGRALSATALGFYTLAFRLPELIILGISIVAARVLFPAFTNVEQGSLGRAFLISLRYTLAIGVPLAAGLAILAEPFILVAFGDQWGDSVAPMQVLTIYALGITVGLPAGTVYKATGRAGVLLKLGIARLALLLAGLWLFVDQGITAVAACQAVVAGLAAFVGLGLASRLLHVGVRPIAREVWPTLVATGVMSGVLVAVVAGVDEPVAVLVLGGLAGSLAYLGTLWALRAEWLRYLQERLMARAPIPEGPPAAELGETRETDVIV